MRKNRLFFPGIILIFILFGVVSALNSETDKTKWTVDDVLRQESAGSFDISPDGKWVVWVKSRPDKEADRKVGDLYLTSLTDSLEIQLTRSKESDQNPQWSPDGKLIAFTSVRGKEKEKKNQVWLINPRGGEPWQLTSLKNGVRSFRWRDAENIVFSAREDPYLYEQELKEKKDDSIVVGDEEHFLPVRLFQVSVKSKKVTRLSMNNGKVQELAVSPDGRWVVTSEAQDVHYDYDNRVPPRQFLYDLVEKKRTEIFAENGMKPFNFVWTLDSKGFFCSQRLSSDPDDDYVSISTLYYFDVESGRYERVPLNWEWQLGFSGYHITKEGLLVALANGPWNKLAFYEKVDGKWQRAWLDDERWKHIRINDVSPNGRTCVFTYSNASTPPVVKVAQIQNHRLSDERKIIELNKWMRNKGIAKSEIVRWKGARGDSVDGILYYPHNYEPGRRYPLMASIHGGPSGADMDWFRESWSSYPNVLASRDVFVLKVNYHGSGNYGLKWVESIKGHYYEYEVPDILKGIDYLIEKGLVDKDRVGIMGWSNGAILAIQCVIESDRFKVVAPGAGDVNWTSDYGNCAFGAGFDNAYFGGPPWQQPKYYIKKSPLFKMQKVTTPTIIFFGTKDTSVPTEQGWEHYRALQQIGKAPVRFILFPGEPHGLRKLSHQRRKMEEELAWFDRYLFDTFKKPNEALKKNSPLALSLKKIEYAKSGTLWGRKVKDALVPEVVHLDSLRVGRFEVTRAQYAAFDENYRYKPGTDNYPVNGITFEQAQQYCVWLSGLSGEHYRLPTEREMKKLLEKAQANADHENNLNYWVGYDITPDEVVMLREEIRKIEQADGLLKSVGSFRPIGHEDIYDLGGNVSEWCITKNGSGKVMGGCAIMPKDGKSEFKTPPLRYIGFRVVLE